MKWQDQGIRELFWALKNSVKLLVYHYEIFM
jgi:hypothetical protein